MADVHQVIMVSLNVMVSQRYIMADVHQVITKCDGFTKVYYGRCSSGYH